MIELRKVGLYEMFWSFDKRFSVELAYKTIKALVPKNDFILADYYCGPNYFAWWADGDGWQPLSLADELEAGIILGIYTDKCASITSKMAASGLFASMDCHKFLEVPSVNDYLFFMRDASHPSGYQVKAVAWGFVIPPNKSGGEVKGSLTMDDRVRVHVAFLTNGVRVPNTPFEFKKSDGTSIHFTTDEMGLFSLGLMTKGKSYSVRRSDTGEVFPLVIEPISKIYEFSSTQSADLEVALLRDNNPVVGEAISVLYDNKVYDVVTNEQGIGHIKLQYSEGATCVVRALDEQKSVEVTMPLTKVVISVDTPKAEPCKPQVLIIKDSNGEACGNYEVVVDHNSTRKMYLSDGDGCVQLPYMEPESFMTIIDGKNSSLCETYKINTEQNEYLFVVPADRDIVVNICDGRGRSVTGGCVTLSQNQSVESFVLVESGSFIFKSSHFAESEPINLALSLEDREFLPCGFYYTSDEDEYQVVLQERPTPWWKILLYVVGFIMLLVLLQMFLDFLLMELGYDTLMFF